MAIYLYAKSCVGCGCCSDVCQQGALGIEKKAVLYETRCIECGECIEICPVGALRLEVAT